MAWVCCLQMGDFEVHATSMGKFAGFCLDDPEIAQAIKSRDPRLLDALNEFLSQWEEIWAIQSSKDSIFWDVVYNLRGPKNHIEQWERTLRLIVSSDLANEQQRAKAKAALNELALKKGEGLVIPRASVSVDCRQLNLLLTQYDCTPPDFYASSAHLPKEAPGVYLLWKDDNLDYIGHSINVRTRLNKAHRIYRKDEHLIGLVSIPEERRQKVVEIALIGALHPAQNNQWSLI